MKKFICWRFKFFKNQKYQKSEYLWSSDYSCLFSSHLKYKEKIYIKYKIYCRSSKIGEYLQTRPRKDHQPLRKQKYDERSPILRLGPTLTPTLFNKKHIDIHSIK